MRGSLPLREPETLARWEKESLYQKIRAAVDGSPLYTLHDGPPYANGHLHLGHAVNKILKDIIIKSKTMNGYDAPFVPGWDCHGLPIEHQVLKELGNKRKDLSNDQIRKICRDYAKKYVDIQCDEFKRLGVLGDWANPYLTMTPDYEASILLELAKFVSKGVVYRGKKPVLWCASCETALAEAEVEYEDHISPSIYVKFTIQNPPNWLLDDVDGRKVSFIIWTTTPWTLIANQAVSLHPDFEYSLLNISDDETWIIAKDCLPLLSETLTAFDHIILRTYKGRDFDSLVCKHPLSISSGEDLGRGKSSLVILGSHVTAEQGTGCVHTAPGHGQEDYEIGREFGLEPWAPVDHKGYFTSDIPKDFNFILSEQVFEANNKIINTLSSYKTLVAAKEFHHSYPHCWRCKKPVIFRATEQWFVSMETQKLRAMALEEVKKVHWIPSWGEDRMAGTIEARPDWCLSRQRVWGVPIPALRCEACKQTKMEVSFITDVAALVKQHGADIWFNGKIRKMLPKEFASICSNENCASSSWELTTDILDVWFESGVTHAAVLKDKGWWPADLYLEGSDQHRGWFQSSLLSGVIADNQAPYHAVLTHGFVVDGEGKKMSKSSGNVISPQEVIKQYGSEILRLWVAAQNYKEDIRISPDILKQHAEAYRKMRNTFRFMLGNLSDFDPKEDLISYDNLIDIDRWALLKLHDCIERIIKAYDDFEFHLIFHRINHFFSVDLSSIYFDVIKDRLYTYGKSSRERRAAQTVIYEILISSMKLLTPIFPFTMDEVERSLPETLRDENGVFFSRFPAVSQQYCSGKVSDRWDRLLVMRSAVSAKLEDARRTQIIGSALEANVTLYVSKTLKKFLDEITSELIPLFIVSQLNILAFDDIPSTVEVIPLALKDGSHLEKIGIDVIRAEGKKCVRCWMYHLTLHSHPEHPELCTRCLDAIN